ncbi:MAG: lysine--tRNA ligase [Candidatus Omnitrophota bacterium]
MSKEKLDKISANFGNPFMETAFDKPATIKEILDSFEENKVVSVAGRLVTKREHGKSSFANIADYTGKIQVYARLDILAKYYELFKDLDIGDIIGVRGKLFKTHTGESTILVEELKLLSKIILPLPEKWHGLRDVEIRYRQRYLDLIANPEVKEIFLKRSRIISQIRDFFNKLNFMEVETPMLHTIAGGAAGRPFVTHHNALDFDVYLRIAPELYLKRLLVGGFDKVYEINRSFRNEGISTRHSPEFTMLEAYCCYNNYEYMMKLCEELFCSLAKDVNGSLTLKYQDGEIDLTPPWQRISFAEVFKDEFGILAEDNQDVFLQKITAKLNLAGKGLSRSQILNITEELVEKKFPKNKPAFIVDFFTWNSPLAKKKKDSPYLVERFELFIAGLEVANAYSELNDPIEQKERFKKQMETEEELPKKIDNDFVTALSYAMPPATGLGIGIDRLVMLLLNQPSIRDVILFPLLKPVSEEEQNPEAEKQKP